MTLFPYTTLFRSLKSQSPSYPLHVVKVPKDMGFVDKNYGDVFFIRYDDIFNLFHFKRLDRSLVRLVSLSLSHQIIIEKTPNTAIMDPFYMLESNMANHGNRVIVTKQIEDFMVANKHKKILLMPYFPE